MSDGQSEAYRDHLEDTPAAPPSPECDEVVDFPVGISIGRAACWGSPGRVGIIVGEQMNGNEMLLNVAVPRAGLCWVPAQNCIEWHGPIPADGLAASLFDPNKVTVTNSCNAFPANSAPANTGDQPTPSPTKTE